MGRNCERCDVLRWIPVHPVFLMPQFAHACCKCEGAIRSRSAWHHAKAKSSCQSYRSKRTNGIEKARSQPATGARQRRAPVACRAHADRIGAGAGPPLHAGGAARRARRAFAHPTVPNFSNDVVALARPARHLPFCKRRTAAGKPKTSRGSSAQPHPSTKAKRRRCAASNHRARRFDFTAGSAPRSAIHLRHWRPGRAPSCGPPS